jgi:hypothetical protein
VVRLSEAVSACGVVRVTDRLADAAAEGDLQTLADSRILPRSKALPNRRSRADPAQLGVSVRPRCVDRVGSVARKTDLRAAGVEVPLRLCVDDRGWLERERSATCGVGPPDARHRDDEGG